MGIWTTIAAIAGMTALTVVAIWLQQRAAGADGNRVSTSVGDGLGNLIDVFDPGQARAARDLRAQQNQGPVAPVPDPDPEDRLAVEFGPDGRPRRVRARKPDPGAAAREGEGPS